MIRVIRDKIREEIVFAIVALLALVSCFFSPFRFEAIDWHVIALLFVLMGFTLVFEKYQLLDFLAYGLLKKCSNTRKLSLVLITLTAGLAAFITNDVALLTVVPITLLIAKRASIDPLKIVVAETMAANIGSSLTPFGNPQNLYLYSFYNISPIEFFRLMAPLVFFGLLFVVAYVLTEKNQPLEYKHVEKKLRYDHKWMLFLVLFVFVIMGIFRWMPINTVMLVSFLALLIFEPKLLLKVDFYLLGTFIAFFIAIDNISRIDAVYGFFSELVSTPLRVFGLSVLSSQVISNVPSAVLVSGFTKAYQPLLLGVSVGGLGTLVASLANLISYKIYVKAFPNSAYRKVFYKVNVLGLIYLSVVVMVIGGFIYELG